MKHFIWVVILVLGFQGLISYAPKVYSNENLYTHENFVPGFYLIKFKTKEIKDRFDLNGVTEDLSFTESSFDDRRRWSRKFIQDRLTYNQIVSNPNLESIQKELELTVENNPNDPFYSSSGSFIPGQFDQWNLRSIDLNPVGSPISGWNIETGEPDVIVAVIDTGIDLTHPDLQNNLWVNSLELNGTPGVDDDGNGYVDDVYGYNFFSDNNNLNDVIGHGTTVSGVISAATNNSIGIAGVCWSCKLMTLRAFGTVNSTVDTVISEAIYYAVDNGAKIINLSLGGAGYSQFMQDAINYANTNDVLVVAASGNNADDSSFYSPASLRNVITVNALNYSNVLSSFSNFGDSTDLSAPGEFLLTTRRQGDTSLQCVGTIAYSCVSGTSFAAPHVAGLAALIYSHRKDSVDGWTMKHIRKVLLAQSNDLGPLGFDQSFGFGKINSSASLFESFPIFSEIIPTVSLTTPSPSYFGTNFSFSGSVNANDIYAYYITFRYLGIPNANLYTYTGRGNKSNQVLMQKTIDLPQGNYEVSLVAEDFSGITSAASTINITIDRTAPSSFNQLLPTTDWTNDSTPEFSWQSSSDPSTPVEYELFLDNVLYVSDLSSTTYQEPSPISDGTKIWRVRAIDAVGNFRDTSNRNLRIDTVIPDSFSIGENILSTSAVLTFSTTDSLSGISYYQVNVNNAGFINATSPYTTQSFSDGTYPVSVRAYDNAGNYREVSSTFTINQNLYYLKTVGDLNGNSVVDISDLSILATYWNSTNPSADMNNDGIVNISDLSILAFNWLKTF